MASSGLVDGAKSSAAEVEVALVEVVEMVVLQGLQAK